MGQSTSIVFSMRSMSFLLAARLTSGSCCKLRSAGTRYALAFLRIRGRLRIRTNAFPHKATRLLRQPSGTLFWALHSGHVTCNVRVPHETRIDAENGHHANAAVEGASAPVARARARRRRGLRDGDSLRGLRGLEVPMVRIPRANAHARSSAGGRAAQARDRSRAHVARPPHRSVAG